MSAQQPTWIRNPQNPEDEHEWTQWFADPKLYRDVNLLALNPADE